MGWESVVFLRILGGSVFAPIAFRLLGSVERRERASRIMLQYAWAALFALGIALVWGFTPSDALWPIFITGMFMPLGVYFQWGANAMSVSRSALFSELSAVIPLFLSAVLLAEWRVFAGNGFLLAGFACVVLGVALHGWSDIKRKRQEEREKKAIDVLPAKFYWNALAFALIFALATFFQNVWAKGGVGIPEFMVSWYAGALLSSIVFFAITRRDPRSQAPQMSALKEQFLILLAAVSIVLALSLSFVAFTLVEQTVALPIFSIGAIIGPLLVGMILFKEWKAIHGRAWVYLGIAVIGAFIMALAR